MREVAARRADGRSYPHYSPPCVREGAERREVPERSEAGGLLSPPSLPASERGDHHPLASSSPQSPKVRRCVPRGFAPMLAAPFPTNLLLTQNLCGSPIKGGGSSFILPPSMMEVAARRADGRSSPHFKLLLGGAVAASEACFGAVTEGIKIHTSCLPLLVAAKP